MNLSFNTLKEKLNTINYWYDNINWLQEKFPDAKYADVVGLCKVADREEYVDENDYSLNAGRYVGVALEDDNLSEEDFREKLNEKYQILLDLNISSQTLENTIITNLQKVL